MATAWLDQGTGQICDLTSSFEWTIPRTLLQNTNVAAKSPAHAFFGATWNVWMFRNNSGTCFFLRKEPTDQEYNNGDGYAIKANVRAIVDGKEYPLHTAKPTFFEARQASQYFISSEKRSDILWKRPEGDLKIICILKFRDFMEELKEIPSKTSAVLSRRDASTETVQEDLTKTTAEKPDESSNGVIPAASAVLSRRDASTETVQEDLTKTTAEKPDESNNAVIPAGTWQARISHLYDTKENADVRISVNGRVFEAHRFVLAMRSPEFSRILISPHVHTHIIDEESVTEAAFDVLLRFLYTDTLGTIDKQTIVEAYLCALACRVADLQEKCKEEMEAWDITTEEIFSLLDLGLDMPTLKDKCMRLLQTEGRTALSHPAFLKISSKCLQYVLECGVLENVPVFEQIERIIEWRVHPHAESANYADARNKLLDDGLLGRLGFEKLELQELTLVLSRYQGLITPEELMCFLKYKHTKDASILPDWCVTSSISAS